MYNFNTNGSALHFEFPEGQIDFNEVLQAVAQAGRLSLRNGVGVRVTIAGMEAVGSIETRHTPGRIYPPIVTVPTFILHIPPDNGYSVYVSPTPSPFYRLCIPGVIDSIDQHIMAFCPDFNRQAVEMLKLVFNLSFGAIMVTQDRLDMHADWRVYPPDYNNIRSYRDMLSKKPRVPKAIDFGPILVKLFGEKIAAAILKEINK